MAQTGLLVNRVFFPCQKRGRFAENGENDEFAFYPLKTRASLLRPPKTTKMSLTKMAGVTQAKGWFRKSRVCQQRRRGAAKPGGRGCGIPTGRAREYHDPPLPWDHRNTRTRPLGPREYHDPPTPYLQISNGGGGRGIPVALRNIRPWEYHNPGPWFSRPPSSLPSLFLPAYHSNFLDYTSPFYFSRINWRNNYTADYTKSFLGIQ